MALRKRGYWNLKEEALDRTLWKTRFRREYGPVLKQTTELKRSGTDNGTAGIELRGKNYVPSPEFVKPQFYTHCLFLSCLQIGCSVCLTDKLILRRNDIL